MIVCVNGEAVQLDEATTVAALVALRGAPARGVAVAVDGQVVPRSSWEVTAIGPGARVEILAATQGG